MVPGGDNNTASGWYSFAAGRRAKIAAVHDGAFLFADSTDADFNSAAADEFAVRASGGVVFYTNSALSAGVVMAAGAGAWSPVSARDAKENFAAIDPVEVLEKVAAMPIETWNYKSQDAAIRHMGPMAEDFHGAFGIGDFEGRITTIDADGVALAAIQGLNQKLTQKLEEKQAAIDALNERLESYDEQFKSLEQRLLAMETN